MAHGQGASCADVAHWGEIKLQSNVRYRAIADIELAAKLRGVKGLHPISMAKWLGLAYAAGVILFLSWGADAPDVVLLSFLFLPWIVGPAAMAAFGAKRSSSEGGAWAFFILESLVVGATVLLWLYLIIIAPDPQNGAAIYLIPVFQYAAVLVFFVIAALFGWRSGPAEAQEPRG